MRILPLGVYSVSHDLDYLILFAMLRPRLIIYILVSNTGIP